MTAAALETRLTTLWETPYSFYGWFATVDHKGLGIRYLVTAFVFLVMVDWKLYLCVCN
jgi:heme/copper-type cytochrome/quinol oxidase subunit 1